MKLFASPIKIPALHPTDLIGLSIAVSVAAYFRLSRLGELLIFATDQGRAMLAGRNILLGHLTWRGPETSVSGLSLGPLYYYLTAIALWFSRFDPIGPAIMTALFGVAAVSALYWYVKQWWGREVGIIAALALALSPLATAQARIAIEPSPLPFVTVLWLMAASNYASSKNHTQLILSGLLGIIGMQFNFSAIVLLGATGILWLQQSRLAAKFQKIWPLGLAGIAGLIAGKILWSQITTPAYIVTILTQLTFPTIPAASTIILMLIGSTWIFLALSRPKASAERVVFFWLALSALAFALKTVAGDHALGLVYAAPALLLALTFTHLLPRLRLDHVIYTTVLVFFLWSTQTHQAVFSQRDKTIHVHQRVINAILAAAHNEPYEFLYRGHLDVYDAADDHYQYLLWLAGNPPVRASRIDFTHPPERWLLTQNAIAPKRTIILYFPSDATSRYALTGDLAYTSDVAIEVIQRENP